MTLTASVKDNNDGEIMVITRDYPSKKEFKETLNQNGFTVIGRIYAEGDENTRKGNLYYKHGIR